MPNCKKYQSFVEISDEVAEKYNIYGKTDLMENLINCLLGAGGEMTAVDLRKESPAVNPALNEAIDLGIVHRVKNASGKNIIQLDPSIKGMFTTMKRNRRSTSKTRKNKGRKRNTNTNTNTNTHTNKRSNTNKKNNTNTKNRTNRTHRTYSSRVCEECGPSSRCRCSSNCKCSTRCKVCPVVKLRLKMSRARGRH